MKLKPCPFCGGEARWANDDKNWIECSYCRVETRYCEDTQEAIEAWNRRKPLEDIVEQLEELAEEHPYKVIGEPDTYQDYNQAWEVCSDRAIEIVKGGAV